MNNDAPQNRDEKRLAILRTAAQVFARFGFKKTALTDIAEQAGLAKASLYYYFDSKEELFSAVVLEESNTLLKAMRAAVSSATGAEEKIRALVRTRRDFMRKKKNLSAVTYEELHEVRPLILKERDKFLGAEIVLLRNILQEGIDAGVFDVNNPELVALVALSGLQGLDFAFWRYGRSEDLADGSELMLDVFIKGLRAN